jgi:hypothetical protein
MIFKEIIVSKYINQLHSKLHIAWEPKKIEIDLLVKAGLWPRFTPNNFISLINDQSKESKGNKNRLIILLILCWINIQKCDRLLLLNCQGKINSILIQREAENIGHTNWDIFEHPEWLLMELGMDLMIRDVQIDVTQAMMKPKINKNTVMQLNMGEGKTAVIVPLLCAALANGDNLVQVTVLKSLLKMNKHSLQNKLASFLNRKLYILPFRRDFQLVECNIKGILQILKEIRDEKGVLLTLPEYKL